jgi:uncharacterized LabA/DUF88 family protein
MTFKREVDTIILVTGDSDFVPAAKLARREGGTSPVMRATIEFVIISIVKTLDS